MQYYATKSNKYIGVETVSDYVKELWELSGLVLFPLTPGASFSSLSC